MCSISIIVPAYNAEKSIVAVLNSIVSSIEEGDEVIVVNDASTDQTLFFASQFDCRVLSTETNKGPGHARNRGAEQAKNEVLLFIDSDVIVKKEQIHDVRFFFRTNPDVQTLTANLSPQKQEHNFFSDYKNLYMNYTISACGDMVNYVYGAFCASRKKGMLPWPESIRLTEDSLWGHRQYLSGQKIQCLREVEVIHLKQYDFFGLIKNDFFISSQFAKSFIENARWNTLYSNEKFGHTPKAQKASVLLSSFSIALCLLNMKGAIFLGMIWFILNFEFFIFIFKGRGSFFLMRSVLWTFIDHLIYFCGIANGLFSSVQIKGEQQPEQIRP